jgi:hypothetical protein
MATWGFLMLIKWLFQALVSNGCYIIIVGNVNES